MAQSSSSVASGRVVSINGLGRDRNPGFRILGECRDQLVSGLCSWLREIAAPVSEELFVLADSTRERLLQTRYLDLRSDIEKDWNRFVETFRRDLSAAAERCQNLEAPKVAGAAAMPVEIPDFDGLQLVDDQELSEHIVVREFAAQLSETCDEELYTLNRRVAALLGYDEQADSVNPLAPQVVCDALSDACTSIGADAESRLILLRRLERHLHLGLPKVYRQINAYLIERGILPDLKRTYRRVTTSGGDSVQANAPVSGEALLTSVPGAVGGGGNAGAPVLDSNGIMAALQRLAQMRTAPMTTGFAGGSATSTDIGVGQTVALDSAKANELLLASLNALQHAPLAATGESIVNQVRLVRESEDAKQVGGLEAVTIDIVAMLFDFIFDDTHVPVAIKALLSRLQIPVLKVAMLNPGFFADRQHPTRRFISSVSGISIRWGSAVDESDPFYVKLAELIDRIQAEFEDDVDVFGKALVELEDFVNEHESVEDTTTLTAANLVVQRELEAEAWDRAQRAVRAFRVEQKPPRLIDAFLGDHWVGALQRIGLEFKDDSDEWRAAVQVMDDLTWSIQVKKTPADRLKLISLLPKLLARINHGLDGVSVPGEERKVFFDALVQLHSAALRGESVGEIPAGEPAPAAEVMPAFKPGEEGDLLVTRSIDNGVEVEEVILVGATPLWRADDREIFRQVNDLKRGDWVEFCDDEGHHNRERLNWISPQRGILLFSNHRSAKAISIAPDALVRQIRDGKATLLLDEAIFERALSGALESVSAG